MDPEFWHERWQNAQIGFHQPKPNPKLAAYWPRLAPAPGSTVFVPLCGKSLDMVWLADHGHHVIGIELSERAVDEFFAEQGLTPETRRHGELTLKSSGPYELWCGDFFEMTAGLVDGVAGLYDRAALVALPPPMRQRYTTHLLSLFPEAAPPPGLLITLEYDQARIDGPPHSVPQDEVERHFSPSYRIEECHRASDNAPPPKFIDAGLTDVTEVAYLLHPRTEGAFGGHA